MKSASNLGTKFAVERTHKLAHVSQQAQPSYRPGPTLTRGLWIIVGFLMLIGIAIITRRSLSILAPSPAPPRFPGAGDMDSGFEKHPVLTMIHIIPGLLFILLGPLQFVRRLRTRYPRVHRWMGRVFVFSSLIIGVSALAMSAQMSIGGRIETAATTFFGIVFLFDLTKAFLAIRQRRVAEHRRWMIRTFAIGLAVTTIRPIVGIFFATSRLTHLTPHDFFGPAFWIGFLLHWSAAELWIRYTGPSLPVTPPRLVPLQPR